MLMPRAVKFPTV